MHCHGREARQVPSLSLGLEPPVSSGGEAAGLAGEKETAGRHSLQMLSKDKDLTDPRSRQGCGPSQALCPDVATVMSERVSFQNEATFTHACGCSYACAVRSMENAGAHLPAWRFSFRMLELTTPQRSFQQGQGVPFVFVTAAWCATGCPGRDLRDSSLRWTSRLLHMVHNYIMRASLHDTAARCLRLSSRPPSAPGHAPFPMLPPPLPKERTPATLAAQDFLAVFVSLSF